MDLEKALERIKVLEKNEQNQNRYITDLEGTVKKLKAAIKEATDNGVSVDSDTTKIVYEMRSEKFKEQATQVLIDGYGQEIFNAMSDDWDKWITENVKHENATKELYIQSFQMVYGQAIMDKEHAVHKIGKTDNQQTEPQPVVEKPITNPLEINRDVMPPTMNGEEGGTLDPRLNTPPTSNVKSTDDAVKILRQRMVDIAAGKDPYETEYN